MKWNNAPNYTPVYRLRSVPAALRTVSSAMLCIDMSALARSFHAHLEHGPEDPSEPK